MQIMIIWFVFTEVYISNVKLDLNTLHFVQSADTTKIRIPGWEITDEIGAPELPSKTIRVALPLGTKIEGIEILSATQKEFDLPAEISFAQKPVILSQKTFTEINKPDKKIYLSTKPYPEEILKFKGSGIFDNHQICEVICVPFQYYPLSRKLVVYDQINFALHYEGGINTGSKSDFIKKLVSNPYDITITQQKLEREQVKYLIITESPMDTVFQRLAQWKTKKGIPAKVRSVNWIISCYPGEDSAAKIRNYLKTLTDSNTQYVLLAGDIDFIPCRFAYAMTCSAGFSPGREDTMPCDLYYSDLQGDWDFDNDGSYGEIEDSIDLYPDLLVGRAPVNTIAEAQKFVEKILIYEKNPPLGYIDNGLFAAEILWADPYTDQGVHKNKIGDESFPEYFELTKLYQSLGNETKESVMQAIRQGQNLINHDGHGWIDLISVGGWPNRIYSADFDTITNGPRYGILYSIGCWTSAFDYASVSEAFVNSPNGGGVAYIGNSSYGWGSPGNPGFGYSDRFDSRFFHSLFLEENFHLGEALALAKAHFIPYSREENVYRWHQYQINLLGDPEMPVWTKIPDTLVVSCPQSVPVGNATILITVKNKENQSPVRNALVCLMKGTESYASGYTDASGTVFLHTTATTTGNFDLTVSAHNYLPTELTIPVISGSYVNYQGWLLNDIFGNNDHIANPGEDILLSTKLRNCGNANADSITLILSTTDTIALILDSAAYLHSLPAGDSTIIDNAFAVKIKNNAINGNCIEFNISIVHNNQTLNFKPNILVGTPMIKIANTNITTLPALPGEIESLYIDLRNYGYGAGHSCRAGLESIDPYVFVLIDTVRYGEVPAESVATATEPFVVYISPFCPSAHLSKLLLNVRTENYVFTDTASILVGETGFSDDIESGPGLWTVGGINNLWHISTRRYFSQTHSWYCGDDNSGQYVSNMNCYIQTIPFMVQKNSLLKFCRWFSVPIYGTDGIYVIVMHDGNADTLDFIGTGGALEQRPIQSNWFEEKYLLNNYSAGDTIQIRITFISDNDGHIGEGFYIDNVNVEYIANIDEDIQALTQNPVLSVYPNPFPTNLTIKFQIQSTKSATNSKFQTPSNKVASITIYDVLGRAVKSFNDLTNCSLNQVIWSGEDNAGRKSPAGIYFVELRDNDYRKIEKVILLK